jgi:hypothetical protein
VLLKHLPPEAVTHYKFQPDRAGWGLTEQLLAATVDALRGANWQRSGGKGAKPKPIFRPGSAPKQRTMHHGHTNRPPDEVAAYLRRFAPPRT